MPKISIKENKEKRSMRVRGQIDDAQEMKVLLHAESPFHHLINKFHY